MNSLTYSLLLFTVIFGSFSHANEIVHHTVNVSDENPINAEPCPKVPCENGGICNDEGKCECVSPYTRGAKCEDMDPYEFEIMEGTGVNCTGGPCRCMGTKVLNTENFECEDPCPKYPCKNGGRCNDEGMCECVKYDTSGFKCQKVDCPTSLENCTRTGGECSYEGDQVVCSCKGEKVLNQEKNQCQNACEPNPCFNDGECTALGPFKEEFICTCKEGFQGKVCREGVVPGKIWKVEVVLKRSTRFTVLVLGPGFSGGFPIISYVMHCRNIDDPEYKYVTKKWEKNSGGETSYLMDGLKPGATYNCSIAAENEVGIGPWYSVLITTQQKTVPDSPVIRTKAETVSRYRNSIDVSWEDSYDNGSPISEYEIRYEMVKRTDFDKWQRVGEDSFLKTSHYRNSYQLTDLEPNTYYRIHIRASNELGWGQASSVVIKTAGGDVCGENHCLNGGTCKVENGNPTCYCEGLFYGDRCQGNIRDLCREIYCLNGGVCRVKKGQGACYCESPFYGDRCQAKSHSNTGSKEAITASSVFLFVIAVMAAVQM